MGCRRRLEMRLLRLGPSSSSPCSWCHPWRGLRKWPLRALRHRNCPWAWRLTAGAPLSVVCCALWSAWQLGEEELAVGMQGNWMVQVQGQVHPGQTQGGGSVPSQHHKWETSPCDTPVTSIPPSCKGQEWFLLYWLRCPTVPGTQ